MNTAANAPKIPAKNSATLSFMVPRLALGFATRLLKLKVWLSLLGATASTCDETPCHKPPPSAIKRYSLLAEALAGAGAGLLSPLPVLWEDRLERMTPVDRAGACGRATHTPTHHTPGYFGGLIEGGCSSLP